MFVDLADLSCFNFTKSHQNTLFLYEIVNKCSSFVQIIQISYFCLNSEIKHKDNNEHNDNEQQRGF